MALPTDTEIDAALSITPGTRSKTHLLRTVLKNMRDVVATFSAVTWTTLTGKPSTFASTIPLVSGLQTALDAKADDTDLANVRITQATGAGGIMGVGAASRTPGLNVSSASLTVTVTASMEYWLLIEMDGRSPAEIAVMVNTALAGNGVLALYECLSANAIGARLARTTFSPGTTGLKNTTLTGIAGAKRYWVGVWCDVAAGLGGGMFGSALLAMSNSNVNLLVGLTRPSITLANAFPSTAPTSGGTGLNITAAQPLVLLA